VSVASSTQRGNERRGKQTYDDLYRNATLLLLPPLAEEVLNAFLHTLEGGRHISRCFHCYNQHHQSGYSTPRVLYLASLWVAIMMEMLLG
jgi:hypothetical protein